MTDAQGDYVDITYTAAGDPYAQSVQKTVATNYIDGANVGQSVFFTDSAQDGAVIETISSTGQRIVYSNFTADYQPQRGQHLYQRGSDAAGGPAVCVRQPGSNW